MSTVGVALLIVALLASCGDGAPTVSQEAATIPATATPGIPGAQVTAAVSGTLTFVDPSRRIINVTTQSGAVEVLSVATAAAVAVDGANTTLTNLGNRIGSKVTAKYNPANGIATNVEVSD